MSSDYLLKGDYSELESCESLDWRVEAATSKSAIAYQLGADPIAHDKLAQRLSSKKPALLILSREPKFEPGCPYWVVKPSHWEKLLHLVCERFFPLPTNLKLLAVTGTNGKTTTADLTLQLGEMAGLRGFSVGTLGVRSRGKTCEEFGLTTPGQIQLRQILNAYGRDCDFAVMEASSHALDQDRTHGLIFEAAAWTNLTQDHLDYHKTMDDYFAAKEKLFNYLAPHATLGVPASQADLIQRLKKHSNLRIINKLQFPPSVKLPAFFSSEFNQENLACAEALISSVAVDKTKLHFEKLLPPPGRFYVRQWEGRVAIVDFAHTPDALENILRAIRDTYKGFRLITLFGCGGDRDRSKRPLMAKVADQFSDQLIVTSDNPRTENPEQIIQDILTGIKLHPCKMEVDRPTAVREALAALQSGEVLLMAGKGHEDYILKGTVKIPYSDIEELDRFVCAKG